jgi:hypothetical protein
MQRHEGDPSDWTKASFIATPRQFAQPLDVRHQVDGEAGRNQHDEDIVLGSAALDRAKQHVSLWTGCIAGGLLESEPSALVAGLRARREVGQS